MNYEEFEESLREAFKGYHVEVKVWPCGGRIDLEPCEICGTTEDDYEGTSWHHERSESLSTAIEKLKGKL